MAGPTIECSVKLCVKKTMRQFTYTLEEIPISFEIPLCATHIGIVAIDPATFIAALDRETENLRATLAAEAEKEDTSKSKIIVPDIS
jgi:hypothetical protein